MNSLKAKNERTNIKTFSMYPTIDKKLDKIAEKYNTSRSKVLEYLIVNNYDELMKDNKKSKNIEV